jgi:hypothetical protein
MNYYQILGVRATATQAEIEAAYRSLGTTSDIERQIEAGMAYTILSDEERRDAFDQELLRDLQRQEIRRSMPVPVVDARNNTYIHKHYHHAVEPERGADSLLKVGFIWFIMALATTVVFFFMALMR